MKSYNLLKGKALLNNTQLELIDINSWSVLKNKFLSIIAAFYIYERVEGKIERGIDGLLDWIFVSIVYVPLSLFVVYWLYLEFIKYNWSNKLKVDSISSITKTIDEDEPLNINLEVKSKFSTINLDFRNTESDYQQFIEHITRLNSRIVIKHERI